MFAKTIIDSDAFLDMPLSAQALYFHLNMRADDEGFINNPRKIQRMIGASDDDLRVLIAKSFIIPFESGIVVIKHWRIHNYIRSDRMHPTKYLDEKSVLQTKENGAYTIMSDICQADDGQLSGKCHTEIRLDKIRLDKVSIDNTPLTPQGDTTKKTKKTLTDQFKELVNQSELSELLKNKINEWIDYKNDIKKPYKTERGFKQFLTIVAKYSLNYSDDEIIEVINKTMASEYQGIVWEWLNKNNNKAGGSYIDAINNRVNVVDDWV